MADRTPHPTGLDAHIEQLLTQIRATADEEAEAKYRQQVQAAYFAGFSDCLGQVRGLLGTVLDGVTMPEGMPILPASEQPKLPLHASVEELGLTVRIVNALVNNGMRTVADVLDVTDAELRGIANFGETSVRQLELALREANLERLPLTSIEHIRLPQRLVEALRMNGVTTLRLLHRRHRTGALKDYSDEDQRLIADTLRRELPHMPVR